MRWTSELFPIESMGALAMTSLAHNPALVTGPATGCNARTGKRIATVGTLLLIFGFGATGLARCSQDEIRWRHADGSEVTRNGLILSFDADQLVFRAGDREQTVETSRIVDVRSPWDRLAESGERLAAEHQFAEAYQEFGKGLQAKVPEWFRQRLLVGRMRAARERGIWSQAIAAYRELLRAEPNSRFAKELPLAWVSSRPDAALEQSLAELMAAGKPNDRLIAASHGLSTSSRAAATATLQQLTRDIDPIVAGLARAQLWRFEVQPPPPAELEARERDVRKLPLVCQAGPWWLIGNQWSTVDHERSALAFMRIPVLCGDQTGLAARALLAAGDQLQLAGKNEQATWVWRELTDAYAETPEAAASAERLGQ